MWCVYPGGEILILNSDRKTAGTEQGGEMRQGGADSGIESRDGDRRTAKEKSNGSF